MTKEIPANATIACFITQDVACLRMRHVFRQRASRSQGIEH